MHVQQATFEKIVTKGELIYHDQFLFFCQNAFILMHLQQTTFDNNVTKAEITYYDQIFFIVTMSLY